MVSRIALNRAIRNLRDGPRPPAGPVVRDVRICDDAAMLPSATVDGLPPAGQRLRVSDGSAPGGRTLHVAQLGASVLLPRLGALVDAQGRIPRSTVHQAVEYDPTFSSFPYLRGDGDSVRFRPPAHPPRRGPSTVWLPFHATYNYGHFILDAMTSLLAADELGALDAFAPIAPRLKGWQRELLRLAFGERLRVEETGDHVVALEGALFADSLDNFLHRPTEIVPRLRRRVLEGTPPAEAPTPRRIYLSRRGWSMRVMLNEPALEAALTARGFAVIHPEDLSVTRQVQIMRDAEVVVAPTGAGLANALFAPPEAHVIEILPVGFGGFWVRQFRELVGRPATAFEVPDAVPRARVPLRNRLRLGFHFAYEVPLPALLAQVDAAL